MNTNLRATSHQDPTLNTDYQAPPASNINNGYEAPTQEETAANSGYGAPTIQEAKLNAVYGAPTDQESELNAGYGAPSNQQPDLNIEYQASPALQSNSNQNPPRTFVTSPAVPPDVLPFINEG